MITIIAGGKKPTSWQLAAITEYEKRLHKPYDLSWRFLTEDKLAKFLAPWPFTHDDFVIVCDERGQNISSDEYSNLLITHLTHNQNIIILIGGAYGFTDAVRAHADFLWSFSKLVFPHALARLIVTEQTYRAQEISLGHPYHHT